MLKWAIIAGLLGYLVLHPVVMISGHLMTEQDTPLSFEHVAVHEIKRSFSVGMLPWSLAFAFGTAVLGGLYGRLKGVEQVLRDSRVRYQTVVDAQTDYICCFLPNGKCTFVNNAFCRLTGRPRDSLLNRSIFDPEEFGELAAWRSQIEQLTAHNPKTEIEQRVVLPDSTPCWICWIVIAIVDDAGRITEYQIVGRDVTDIRRARKLLESQQEILEQRVKQRTRALDEAVENLQQEIQERIELERNLCASELRYRMLFESTPMGVALTTYEGRMLTANPTLMEMIRLPPGELEEINVRSLYPREEDRNRLLARLKTDQRVVEAEVELQRRDGERFYASMNLVRFQIDGQDTILAVVQDISKRKQALEALRRSETDLQELSARLMSVQEEERKRIAGELHDSVGQLMHAMKFTLETALKQLGDSDDPAEVRTNLERMMPILQEAAAENRRIVMDLRPSMLDDLGLLATVNWFCREFGRVYKAIAIDKTIAVGEGDIPTALRVVLFRIIQEAFTNVAKHSRATRVRLTIAKDVNDLVVEIEDNGIGLQRENRRPGQRIDLGFGLTSMRERARASGGLFHLTGKTGAGTLIRAVWPGQGGPEIKAGLDWQI